MEAEEIPFPEVEEAGQWYSDLEAESLMEGEETPFPVVEEAG